MVKSEATLKMAEGWADILTNPILNLKKDDFQNSKYFKQYKNYLLKVKALNSIKFDVINEEQIKSFINEFYYSMLYKMTLFDKKLIFIDSNDECSSLKYSMDISNIKEYLLPPNTRMNLYISDNDYYLECSKYGLPFSELKVEEKKSVLNRIKKMDYLNKNM